MTRADISTSYDYDETISVLVGPEKAKFTVHRDVVCARSRFFNTACSSRWLEGQEKVVPLSEFEPESFQMYMDLTYSRLVYGDRSSSLPLVKLYVLVDFLDDAKARNEVMRFLLMHRRCPNFETIGSIWETTKEGSLLRKWAVDVVAARFGKANFARDVGMYPARFVQEIAVKLYLHAYGVFYHPRLSAADYLEADDEDLDDE
jgi:hypothetical protein